MKGPSEEFFSCSSLTAEEHSCPSWRHNRCLIERFAQGGALTNDALTAGFGSNLLFEVQEVFVEPTRLGRARSWGAKENA